MKNFIKLLVITLATAAILPSCSKDGDEGSNDNLVGTWDVLRADATADVDGITVDGITVDIDGTLRFNADGTGRADFSMSFLDTFESVEGSFDWRRSGTSVILNMDGEEVTYESKVNDKEYQELLVTYVDEDDSSVVVDFTFVMERLQ